ncbi:hypothetical protein ACFE04_016489 [Oxalis oulophora]
MDNKLPIDSFIVSFKKNPCQPRDIIPLDFKNVQKVPDSHAWTSTDHEDRRPISNEPHVPVIDLWDPRATELIRNACEKWGVFRVVKHGIPLTLLDQAENQTLKLFSLPADRKIMAARTPHGPTGYGLARMSAFFHKLMWFEGFTVSGSPMEHAIKLWPHHQDDRSQFCDVLVEYQKELKALAERLIGIMLSSLELSPSEELKWLKPKPGDTQQHQAMLNLNYYPPCPDPSQAIGLAVHTDSSLLTLLYPSTIDTFGGLQVLSLDNSSWISVEPMKGAIVVNLGDLMQVLTNSRFKSVMHRAVVHKSRSRTSRAYFYGPPKEVKISPATKMIDDGHSAIYRSVSWEEMLSAKAKYFNKALDSIKI